jgi:hypothetical protein
MRKLLLRFHLRTAVIYAFKIHKAFRFVNTFWGLARLRRDQLIQFGQPRPCDPPQDGVGTLGPLVKRGPVRFFRRFSGRQGRAFPARTRHRPFFFFLVSPFVTRRWCRRFQRR